MHYSLSLSGKDRGPFLQALASVEFGRRGSRCIVRGRNAMNAEFSSIKRILARVQMVGCAALIVVTALIGSTGLARSQAGCPAPAAEFNGLNPNLGQLKNWLRAYRCSKYDLEVAEVIAEAR